MIEDEICDSNQRQEDLNELDKILMMLRQKVAWD